MDTLCKKLLWLAIALVLSSFVTAQEIVSKKIEESYTMNNSGELQLENKYGKVNLYGWDKDEVSVSIAITVNHRKRENAEELLRRIQPNFRASDNLVSMNYEIIDKSSGWFGSLFEKANPFDFDRSNIQIDYTVYMPKKAELKVTNTFGDVIIEDWIGKLKAVVAHGDFWINQNLNKADITMRYGKLKAKNISYGTLDLKNGELDMEDSESLRINSSGTDMSLNAIKALELYSNKDDITIEEVGTLYGTLKFTTLELNHLTKDMDMTMKIADFRVSRIIGPESDIAIEQETSDINLNISDFSHQFKATLEEGLVRLPKSYKNIDTKMLDKDKKIRRITASYGKSQQGKITIIGTKGVVLLKED